MSLWIVDGGIGFTLPVIARVEDWKEGEYIDVTGAGDGGKWLPMPVRYVSLSSVRDGQREMADRIERLESENAKLRELAGDMGKMLTLASWTSVENDEQASQCIYRAEALGIEVEQ